MAITSAAAFFKASLLPLFIAALLYLLTAYILLPFLRHHRSRYNQYLPISPAFLASTSDRISASSLRARITDALMLFFIPSYRTQRQAQRWRSGEGGQGGDSAGSESDEAFDEEEGEGMVGFEIDARRREALERRRSGVETEGRLSRELEEGFRDDSDEEDGHGVLITTTAPR